MQRLPKRLGLSEHDLAGARALLCEHLRRELALVVDEAVRRTMALPGYRELDVAVVRPNTSRSFEAVLDALERDDIAGYGLLLADIAYQRAKQGLLPRSFYDLADITEALLNQLADRSIDDPKLLLAATVLTRKLADSARTVIIDNFQRAYLEIRTDVDRLVSQFSAPVLPVLPGVLLLPIVGAISANRAQEIIEAMLAGICAHAARVVILDITGIADADAGLPAHLRRATNTAAMLGAEVFLVGVTPAVALLLTAQEIALAQVRIFPTLATALTAVSSMSANSR
ncbi:MAG: hypothetical protein KC457_09590 [Myxococcales bacterium]|nr:hypothetical protein [Myxococcales bacterium]